MTPRLNSTKSSGRRATWPNVRWRWCSPSCAVPCFSKICASAPIKVQEKTSKKERLAAACESSATSLTVEEIKLSYLVETSQNFSVEHALCLSGEAHN